MNEKLKSCPFCGGEAELDHFDSDEWYICCANLDGECEIRPSTRFYETKEEAIEAWNRRSE